MGRSALAHLGVVYSLTRFFLLFMWAPGLIHSNFKIGDVDPVQEFITSASLTASCTVWAVSAGIPSAHKVLHSSSAASVLRAHTII